MKHMYRLSWDCEFFFLKLERLLWKAPRMLCFNSSCNCSDGLIYFAQYPSNSRDKGTVSKSYNFRNPRVGCRNQSFFHWEFLKMKK